jgi:hypothetical protein
MFSNETIESVYDLFSKKNEKELENFFDICIMIEENIYIDISDMYENYEIEELNIKLTNATQELINFNDNKLNELTTLIVLLKESFIDGKFIQKNHECEECDSSEWVLSLEEEDMCNCCENTGIVNYRAFSLTNESANSIHKITEFIEKEIDNIKNKISIDFINNKNNKNLLMSINEVNKYLTIQDF